jgi:hypothetical protein
MVAVAPRTARAPRGQPGIRRGVGIAVALLMAAVVPNVSRAETQTYEYDYQLSYSYTRTYQGTRAPTGECIWPVPALTSGQSGGSTATSSVTTSESEELPPPQGAPKDSDLEARQISADPETCTTTFQIGVPPKKNEPADLEQFGETGNCKPRCEPTSSMSASTAESTSASAAWQTRKVYYQVAWWDWAGAMLNRVRSYLAWTFNGVNCILGSTGTTGTWRRFETGWYRTSASGWKSAGCLNHYWYSDATFRNDVFCGTIATVVNYDDVRVRGGYRGDYGGWLGGTWVNTWCPLPLHFSAKLVREW